MTITEYYSKLNKTERKDFINLLAEKTGVSNRTVYRWCKNKYNPSFKYKQIIDDTIILSRIVDEIPSLETITILSDILYMDFNKLFKLIKILEAASIEYCNGYKYSIILRSELCSLSKYPIYIHGTDEELHFYGDRLTSLSKATLKLAEIITDISGLSLDNLINKYK